MNAHPDLFGWADAPAPKPGMVRACRARDAARIVAGFIVAARVRPALAHAARPRAGTDALGGIVRGVLDVQFDNGGRRFYAALAGLRHDCGPVPEDLRPRPEDVAAAIGRLETVARAAVDEMNGNLARGGGDA